MGRSNVFPKLVISMIKIGEETGQLSFMLEKLAHFYKREVEATVSALTKAMEPTVIFVVAGIVGTIVISLYLPMFSLISTMGISDRGNSPSYSLKLNRELEAVIFSHNSVNVRIMINQYCTWTQALNNPRTSISNMVRW